MRFIDKIDLHMHTKVSDGTESPTEIIESVKKAGISLFSVTDHDAFYGCSVIKDTLSKGDPAFIYGIEFSCKDEEGQYHILGYGYNPNAPSMLSAVAHGHSFRMQKLRRRLEFIEREFGFSFSDADKEKLFCMENPGKPHIANLMVKYGYASSVYNAIENYLNKCDGTNQYIRPEEAISAILNAGGIPVLAHPCYGRGDELIIGECMDRRLKRLIDFGLKGIEAFYSGFSLSLQKEMLNLAEKYHLYVTAGSDYHGANKLVRLADTNLDTYAEYPEGLLRFLNDVQIYSYDKDIKE